MMGIARIQFINWFYRMFSRGTNAALAMSVVGVKCSIISTKKRSSQKLENRSHSAVRSLLLH
jgi:hypothetical protein